MSAHDFYILKSVPDNRQVLMRSDAWNKFPVPLTPGNAGFFAGVPRPNAKNVVLGAPGMKFDAPLPRRPLVNYIADADVHRLGLAQADTFARQMGTACFNAPSHVAATTRDGVARLLAGIEGLEVPVTVRIRAATWDELRQAVPAAGLRYPVIARLPGDQGAARTVRVEGPGDWEAISGLGWGGRDLYLTQWVDFADADGMHRVVRIALVGGEAFCCFVLEKHGWLSTPEDSAAQDEGARARRDAFAREALPRLRPVLSQVARKLRLDCFAVDGSLRPDGRLLVFEANASNPTRDDMALGPLAAAVRARLADPSSWWGQPQGPSVRAAPLAPGSAA